MSAETGVSAPMLPESMPSSLDSQPPRLGTACTVGLSTSGICGTVGGCATRSSVASLSAGDPSRTPIEPSPNTAASEYLSCSNFDSLRAEIANSTMNSASSTVSRSA